jgi:hypothetical protein
MSCLENEIKFNLLSLILIQRKNAAIKIQRFFKSHIIYHKIKQFFLLKKIISDRINAKNILFNNIKLFLYRKKVFNTIKKNFDYYAIIPTYQSPNMKINILFDKKTSKIYNLTYCPIRKIYLFEFPRNLLRRLIYKFYFILDGSKIIDPKFEIIKNNNNDFYNLINFKEIQEKEFQIENEYSKIIESFNYNKNNISNISTENSFSNDDEDNYIYKKSKSLNSSKNHLIIHNNELIKPILKKQFSRRNIKNKKVSFGKIQWKI